jgi:hypothetical protein
MTRAATPCAPVKHSPIRRSVRLFGQVLLFPGEHVQQLAPFGDEASHLCGETLIVGVYRDRPFRFGNFLVPRNGASVAAGIS